MSFFCKFLFKIISLAAFASMFGCANHHTEKYFERNPVAITAANKLAINSQRATVFFFHKRSLMQSLSVTPRQPPYYAVDGRLTAIMPLGSHVVLSLEPGRHTFVRINVVRDFIRPSRIIQLETSLDVSAGKTYYVGNFGFGETNFSSGELEEGIKIISESELAQFIHQPLGVEDFLNRVTASFNNNTVPAASQPAPNMQSSNLSDVLPTASQVGSFLEGIAAVAIVGLTIFAAAKGGAPAYNAPYSPPNPPTAPSAYVQQAPPAIRWQNSAGIISQIVQSKGETTVYNQTSGIRYRIEDGRITGSDGSRYRVLGSSIFSDTGESYQIIGNTLFASDGRSCLKTGNVVSCR